MKKINLTLITILFILVQNSCATLNRAHGEIHYNNNVSKGKELQDLKKALGDGAINQEEYNIMKEKIINVNKHTVFCAIQALKCVVL